MIWFLLALPAVAFYQFDPLKLMFAVKQVWAAFLCLIHWQLILFTPALNKFLSSYDVFLIYSEYASVGMINAYMKSELNENMLGQFFDAAWVYCFLPWLLFRS